MSDKQFDALMFQLRAMNDNFGRLIDTVNSFLYAMFFLAFLVGLFALASVAGAEQSLPPSVTLHKPAS